MDRKQKVRQKSKYTVYWVLPFYWMMFKFRFNGHEDGHNGHKDKETVNVSGNGSQAKARGSARMRPMVFPVLPTFRTPLYCHCLGPLLGWPWFSPGLWLISSSSPCLKPRFSLSSCLIVRSNPIPCPRHRSILLLYLVIIPSLNPCFIPRSSNSPCLRPRGMRWWH